ncbi:MAG: hypothetical protein HZB46_15345 [Solirubrobacterales bacterium]|nr:hypothetical protein [Solirubrobacterales bacterium]
MNPREPYRRLARFRMPGELPHLSLQQGLIQRQPGLVAAAVVRLSCRRGVAPTPALRSDVERLMARHAGVPIGELRVGELIGEVLEVMRRHRLHVPGNLAMLLKAVVMNEGMGARLDPAFQFADVLAPYAEGFVADQLTPAAVARRLRRAGIEAAQLGVELPEQVRRLLATLDSDGLQVQLRREDIELLTRHLRRNDDRLVAAILGAAVLHGLIDLTRPRGRTVSVGIGAAVACGVLTYLGASSRGRRRRQGA